MLERIRAWLTYANVTATAALVLALAGSAMVARNVIDGSSSAKMVARNVIDGSSSENSVSATWFLGGSSSELPKCRQCEVDVTASGTSGLGSPENSANEQLSPNVPIVASNLSVHVDTAPGAATRKFALFSPSLPNFLSCDISGSNTTCNSGAQTLTITPGTSLHISAINLGDAPPTRFQFSWRATAE